MAIFQVFKSTTKNQYYYLLKATGNSQLILSCDGFSSKQMCLDGIEYVRKNAVEDESFKRQDSYLSFTFTIENDSQQTVAKSENYTSEPPREQIIELIKKDAGSAIIQDLT
ncbi:YegP family protein [Dyadobacter sp. CY345]|uniref:YegP family protein n=1 Tax=Dyadobacter sp. CY345 TaxID=2909335 RepID=UPI001F46E4CB|nr:YegP family protein [Dyadobacter sp. CY345]MCF2443600.1 YegP family protein [Dyadobacter sp. CY345]